MKCQKEPDLSVGLCRHSLATNGKSIGEVREEVNYMFNSDQMEPIFFP